MNMLDDLSKAFVQFDENYFQRAKMDNSKLMMETDTWLQQATFVLENSVIMSVEVEEKVVLPFDLLNSEEIDKILVLADSLKAKISNQEEYQTFEGLELKYNDIRADFDSNFENKAAGFARIVNG